MSVDARGIFHAPIGLEEIASMLGAAIDVGSVCTSPNINIKAKFKPLIWGSPAELTEQQRYILNHGFTPRYITIATSGNPTQMPVWGQWQPPSPFIINSAGAIIGGNGDYARLLDFDGYNPYPVDYIRGVDIHTDHLDEQSIIINNGNVGDILRVADGITLTPQQRNQLNNLLIGNLYIKVSINPDADLKLSDFHWDNPNGTQYPLKDFYWCAALISPKLITSGNSPAMYGYSSKTVGELEKTNTGYDAIEITFPTAPSTALWTAVDSTQNIRDNLILVIGLVRNTNKPTEFWSPCIFTEWSKYTWLKQYTSYKKWNGKRIINTMMFYGGFKKDDGATLMIITDSGLRRHIDIGGVSYHVWNSSYHDTDKINVIPRFSLQLRHSDGTTVTQGGNIDVGTGNSRSWGGSSNDTICQVTFPKTGTYSGTLQLWVDNSYAVVLAYLDNEVAMADSIDRIGDYNGFGTMVTFTINNFNVV